MESHEENDHAAGNSRLGQSPESSRGFASSGRKSLRQGKQSSVVDTEEGEVEADDEEEELPASETTGLLDRSFGSASGWLNRRSGSGSGTSAGKRRRSSAAGPLSANGGGGGRRNSTTSTLAQRDFSQLSKLTTIMGGHPDSHEKDHSIALDDDTDTASHSNYTDALHPSSAEHHRSLSHASPSSHRSRLLASGHVAGFSTSDILTQAESLLGARMGEPGDHESSLLLPEDQHMLLDPAEVLDPEQDLHLPVDTQGHVLENWRTSVGPEFKILVSSALPIFFTQIAELSLILASVISIGHLGTTELAASSLGSMTSSVTCFAILQGMTSASKLACPLFTLHLSSWEAY